MQKIPHRSGVGIREVQAGRLVIFEVQQRVPGTELDEALGSLIGLGAHELHSMFVSVGGHAA